MLGSIVIPSSSEILEAAFIQWDELSKQQALWAAGRDSCLASSLCESAWHSSVCVKRFIEAVSTIASSGCFYWQFLHKVVILYYQQR